MEKDYSKYFVKPSIKDARKRKQDDTPTIDFNEYFNIFNYAHITELNKLY